MTVARTLAGNVRTPSISFGAVRKPGLGLFLGILTGLLATFGIAYGQTVEENAAALADIILAVDTIWFVIAGILVFFMQAGFGLLEAGFVRVKNTTNILMKNVLDASLGAVVWWAVGFGFAFGGSQGGFIGGDSFFPALGGLTETDGVSEAPSSSFSGPSPRPPRRSSPARWPSGPSSRPTSSTRCS